jgi:hypothetical protein
VVSAAAVAVSLLIGDAIITIIIFHPHKCIIGVARGGWGMVDCNKSSRISGVGSLLLVYLLFFFIGVAQDDDLTVARWPKDVTVEVTKKSSGELLIPRDISDETFLIKRWRKIHHWSLPGGPSCSNTGEQGWHEEISDGDPDGGGDLDGVSGGVLVSLGDGLPSLEGEPSVWYLSCPPLLASREQERRTLKASEKEKRTARWLSA